MSKEEQKKGAMDELFKGLINPSTPSAQKENEESASVSSKQKKYKEENERVCTIINVELMNKARYIAGKEGLAIRDVFEFGLKFAIKDYESRNGVIRVRKTKPKKGDANKVFDI